MLNKQGIKIFNIFVYNDLMLKMEETTYTHETRKYR